MKKLIRLKCQLICIIIQTLLLSGYLNAQTSSPKGNDDISHIRWVKQFPEKKQSSKQTIMKRLGNIVFGNKGVINVSKPVAIVATDPNSFLLLDQGAQSLLQLENDNLLIPKAIKKKYPSLTSLVGICKTTDNKILFTDSRLNKIFILNEKKDEVNEFNPSLKLQQPTGIAYSAVNNEFWVVETNAHRIVILDEKGTIKKTFGKRGNDKGEFNFPTSIWIDKLGNAYIIDAMNFRIQIFNKNGEFINVFGQAGDATGYFARAKGIATDSFGNIYISDALFHVVQIFDKTGNYLYKFGGQGREKGEFWMPSGIYIDENNYIYVADSYNSRIQIFQLVNE